jgi:hypothetical protein
LQRDAARLDLAPFQYDLFISTFHESSVHGSDSSMQQQSNMMLHNVQNSANDASVRRVLGDMSPNIRKVAPAGHLNMGSNNKPAASSPLKRSFTASLGSTAGFKYFKRRKGSFENHIEQRSDGSKPVHEIFPLPQVSISWDASDAQRCTVLIA